MVSGNQKPLKSMQWQRLNKLQSRTLCQVAPVVGLAIATQLGPFGSWQGYILWLLDLWLSSDGRLESLWVLLTLSRPSLRGTAYERWETRIDSLWLAHYRNSLQESLLRRALWAAFGSNLLRSSSYCKPVPKEGAVSYWLAVTKREKTRQMEL
jgi:hypothetical protein